MSGGGGHELADELLAELEALLARAAGDAPPLPARRQSSSDRPRRA
jgi:hypothetical protein